MVMLNEVMNSKSTGYVYRDGNRSGGAIRVVAGIDEGHRLTGWGEGEGGGVNWMRLLKVLVRQL